MMNYNWIVWYQWKYHIFYELWWCLQMVLQCKYIKDMTKIWYTVLIKFFKFFWENPNQIFKNYLSLFFFLYFLSTCVSNPWVLSTQILSISFDLFIIALTSFSYLSFNRISIVLLNWLIKLIYFFTRINLLNLLIDIVIQLLYVSSYFQYTYILQLISKLRESIDQCLVENINRYFRGRKIDLSIYWLYRGWLIVVQSDTMRSNYIEKVPR